MPTSPICVDANLVIQLVTRRPEGSPVATRWREWRAEGRLLAAPTLLLYEVSNVLHRYVVHGELEPEEAAAAFEAVLDLEIALYGDADLHRSALALARQHSLPATYNAHYLALSERLEAAFWTADRRLYEAVHAALPRVQLVE